ncbi:hypothetical protein ASG17_06335 [Brevundimonas sp. Leaf363]|nr:hypothetical protein ASG17_06335 [Brevundimonas sp. Leaf363]
MLATTMISGALMAVAAAPAFAQDSGEAEVEDVVVTGSRIVRQDFEAISPVTTVSSETIELTQTLTVDSLLNTLPSVVAGNTRNSNNSGGESFATVDLRGLGPSRTLVLVNGERVPASSTTGVVDINTIPASLIDRVEVVTGGASAVYGSDALAGVINFVLKDDFEGAEISSTYGAAFDGFSPEFEINGLFGGSFANGRGNLTVYSSYYNREGTFQSELPYSRTSGAVLVASDGSYVVADSAAQWLDYVNNKGALGTLVSGGSGTPAWGTVYNSGANPFQNLSATVGATGNDNFMAGGYDTTCDGIANTTPYNSGNLSFNEAGELTPRAVAGACAVPDRSAGSSRYNFAPDNYLIIPAERFTITTIGTYDITDDIKLRTQVSYTNSWQQVQLAPTPATGLVVTLTPAMQSLISNRHPDLWAALQSRPNPLASFTMDRRMNEVGTRVGESENNALAILNTLTGSLWGDWDWSLTGSYGVNNYTDSGQHSTNKTALAQGLAGCQNPDGSPLAGQLPGCVPLDIFGAGTLNSTMVNFLDVPTFSTTEVEEKRIAGFVRGSVFELPAGPISTVFGFEWRESSADYRVDNEQRTGNIFGFNAVQNQKGSIDVKELYTEIAIPLLADLPFVNYLGLEGGYRYSDYSTIGGVDTYKVGLEYEPTDWLKIRTVYNSAVRAPSVFELFQNGDQGFENYIDPCDDAQNPSAQLLAFCSSQAGGYDFTGFTQNNGQTEAFAFGNPNLQPEDAETFTVGVVFQPSTFPMGQFRASLDYYDIEITNLIASFGSQYWISQCYDSLGADTAACARVTRNTLDGQVDFVNTSRGNVGYQKTKGYDLQIDWSIPLEDYTPLPGRLRINELFTYVDSLEIDGDEYAGTGFAGIGGVVFDVKSVLSVAYDISDWTFFTRWTYIGETDDIGFGPNYFDGSPEYLPESSYVDLTARWDVTDMLQVTANVGNVFDKLPPVTASGTLYGQGNIDGQVYRTFGRTFSVSAKARF